MRVMIVDDSRTMRLLVKRALRQAGVEVQTVFEAEDGQDALEKMNEARPHLVLCDWNMPRMSGLELLKQIRRRQLPVHFGFVTSQATPEMAAEARQAGAEFLVAKPLTPDSVRRAIESARKGGPMGVTSSWVGADAEEEFRLPTDRELATMWTQLMNRGVVVTRHERSTLTDRNSRAIAVYTTRGGEVCGVVCADMDLCASAGSVLSLFPPAAVQQAVRSGLLPDGASQNLNEIFNVSSRFFHAASKDFVHLDKVYEGGEELPKEVRRVMRTSEKRASYKISIEGYGAGAMGLWGV